MGHVCPFIISLYNSGATLLSQIEMSPTPLMVRCRIYPHNLEDQAVRVNIESFLNVL